MNREYGSKPENIVAVVGPSICQDCYEVSKEVVEGFDKECDGRFDVNSIYYAKDNGKMQLNLWEANRQILLLAGLKPENIVVSNVCTSCHSDLLFSHRKTNGKRGNLVAIMEIVSQIKDKNPIKQFTKGKNIVNIYNCGSMVISYLFYVPKFKKGQDVFMANYHEIIQVDKDSIGSELGI